MRRGNHIAWSLFHIRIDFNERPCSVLIQRLLPAMDAAGANVLRATTP